MAIRGHFRGRCVTADPYVVGCVVRATSGSSLHAASAFVSEHFCREGKMKLDS